MNPREIHPLFNCYLKHGGGHEFSASSLNSNNNNGDQLNSGYFLNFGRFCLSNDNQNYYKYKRFHQRMPSVQTDLILHYIDKNSDLIKFHYLKDILRIESIMVNEILGTESYRTYLFRQAKIKKGVIMIEQCQNDGDQKGGYFNQTTILEEEKTFFENQKEIFKDILKRIPLTTTNNRKYFPWELLENALSINQKGKFMAKLENEMITAAYGHTSYRALTYSCPTSSRTTATVQDFPEDLN
ncbi:hypothetical protein H8356DRAFT_1361231 [Neocallimastix lanati (nom. inval.)]|nr:hypothetical protein H8356DRAFT_1361231 [Neocallimastix sp. JGI-2020a]